MKPTAITQIAAGIHQITVGEGALILCGDSSRRVRRIEL